jgi:death-on-curing protein
LARPQSGYYNDIVQEAAALWDSLSQNNPFLDGNKRVAVTVTAAFLRVNGYRLEFDDIEAFSFLVDLYEAARLRLAEPVLHLFPDRGYSRYSPSGLEPETPIMGTP